MPNTPIDDLRGTYVDGGVDPEKEGEVTAILRLVEGGELFALRGSKVEAADVDRVVKEVGSIFFYYVGVIT